MDKSMRSCGAHEVLKSGWYLIFFFLLLMFSTMVFSGIEGNHARAVGLELLKEQSSYKESLSKVLSQRLSEQLYNDQISSEEYDTGLDNLESTAEEAMMLLTNHTSHLCRIARNNLTSWNRKSNSDSLMFAVSIISTVGWGVFVPPTDTLRGLCIIYAIIGLPLFAALIGFCRRGVEYLEDKIYRKRWVQLHIGNKKVILIIALLLTLLFILCYGYFCYLLVESELDSEIEIALEYTGQASSWTFLVGLYYVFTTISCIGFGDIYIYSPDHALLNIKPVSCLLMTTLLVAIFAHLFSKLPTL